MGLIERHDRHQSVGAAWSASWCEAPVRSTEPLARHIGAIGPERLAASLDAAVLGTAVPREERPQGAYQQIR